MSVVQNVIIGSQFISRFWMQLIGHIRLKTLNISGMNNRATASLLRITANADCNRAIPVMIIPRLESRRSSTITTFCRLAYSRTRSGRASTGVASPCLFYLRISSPATGVSPRCISLAAASSAKVVMSSCQLFCEIFHCCS